MNDIPRGVSSEDLIAFFATLVGCCALADSQPDKFIRDKFHGSPYGDLIGSFHACISSANITDSRLDDELSVAIIQFHNTPRWFKNRDSDPYGFPKKTKLGTIWKGIDMGKKDEDGRTAFIRAVMDGNLTLAETLAEYEATDVNTKDNEGMTALHWACKEGLTDLTDFCLSIPGLDISLKSNAGLRAFDIAYREALRDENDTIPTLFYKNMFEMDEYDPDNALSRLLTLAAEPGGCTKFPQEALFNPVRNGNLALVQALIKRITFTTPLALNGDGDTVLHVAARIGHVKIVILLIDAGFDVNATARDSYTALHYASQHGHTELIHEILSRGANIDAVERHGRTALHVAAHYGLKLTVQFLLEQNASPDSKDHEGKTPLQTAIDNGLETSEATAEILRSWGCRIGVGYPQELEQTLGMTIHQNTMVFVESEPQYSGDLPITNLQSPHLSRDLPIFTQHSSQEPSITQEISSYGGITATPSLPPSPSEASITQTISSSNTTVTIPSLPYRSPKPPSPYADVELTYSTSVSSNLLTTTVEKEEVRMSNLLLERGGSIEGRDKEGRTALHMAIFQQDVAVVSLLLDHGANIEAGYWTWMSPLEIAERKKNQELVKLLLERGARMMEDLGIQVADSLAVPRALCPEPGRGVDGGVKLDSMKHIVNQQEYGATMAVQSGHGSKAKQLEHIVSQQEYETETAVQLGQRNIAEQLENIVNQQEYDTNTTTHLGQGDITEQPVDGLAGLGLKLDSLTQAGVLLPPESDRELESNSGTVTMQGQDYFNVYFILFLILLPGIRLNSKFNLMAHQVFQMQEAVSGIAAPRVFELPPSPIPEYNYKVSCPSISRFLSYASSNKEL